MKSKIVKDTFLNGFSDVFSNIAGFFLTTFIIRKMGRESYGVFILATSLLTQTHLFELGTGAYISKVIAEYKDTTGEKHINNAISTVFTVSLALNLLIFCLLVIFIRYSFVTFFNISLDLADNAKYVAYLCVTSLIFDTINEVFRRILMGTLQFKIINIILIFRTVLNVILTVILLSAGYGLVGLGYVYLILAFTVFILMTIFTYSNVPFKMKIRLFHFDRQIFNEVKNFSIPLFLGKLFAFFSYKIDTWVLAFFLNPTAVAIYDVGNRLCKILSLSAGYLTSTVLPVAAKIKTLYGTEKLKELFLKGTYYIVLITFPLAFLLIALAKPIILVWVGDKFFDSILLTRLFCIIFMLNIITLFGGNMMIGLGDYKYFLKYNAITTVINLICSLILVNLIGLAGVVMGTLISSLFNLFFQLQCVELKYFQVSFRDFLRNFSFKPLMLSLVPALAFYYLSRFLTTNLTTIICLLTLWGCFYFFLFIKYGIQKSDRFLLQDFMKLFS